MQIHFCVVLWGFTAILGKLITPARRCHWCGGGCCIVVAALALLPQRLARAAGDAGAGPCWRIPGIGVLVALHWLTFYGAIKLANASVAATCIALAHGVHRGGRALAARGRPFSRRELALGIAVLPGVALVVGGVPQDMRIGDRGRRAVGAAGRVVRLAQQAPGRSAAIR